MPFTPAHAVVALPFVRTPLLPAAIAIGAMTPDLPLFLRGTPLTYQATHTNVLLSVTLALVLLVAWYLILRPAARELSPAWLARRLPAEWDRSAPLPGEWLARRPRYASALLLAGSLVIGVLSHIAWDAFTHEGRWGTRLLPALDETWGPLTGYKWLQHGSSVIALGILALCAALWLSRRTPAAAPSRLLPAPVRIAWWLSLPIALAAAWLLGLAAYGALTAAWTAQHLAYRVLPLACGVWGVLTIGLCVVVVVLRRRSAPPRLGT